VFRTHTVKMTLPFLVEYRADLKNLSVKELYLDTSRKEIVLRLPPLRPTVSPLTDEEYTEQSFTGARAGVTEGHSRRELERALRSDCRARALERAQEELSHHTHAG